MDGKYQEGEPMQEIQLTIKFPVKMNPGTPSHLKQVSISHFAPKGIKIVEEGDRIVTYG